MKTITKTDHLEVIESLNGKGLYKEAKEYKRLYLEYEALTARLELAEQDINRYRRLFKSSVPEERMGM